MRQTVWIDVATTPLARLDVARLLLVEDVVFVIEKKWVASQSRMMGFLLVGHPL